MSSSRKENLCILFVALAILLAFSLKPKRQIIIEIPTNNLLVPAELPKIIPEKSGDFNSALQSITATEIKENLTYLASDALEGRMSGKKGNVLAFEMIKKKCESYGLPTMYDKFEIPQINPGPHREIGDGFTQNLYAWIEGNDPVLKDEIIVVGCHGDHIGYGRAMSRAPGRLEIHNGADDNASGTAAGLAIAKAFSLIKPLVKHTVVFQFYSAEEMGLIGSRVYCNSPKFPLKSPDIRKHIAMINLDMVGYLKKGVHPTGFNTGESSLNLTQFVGELNQKYSFARQITSQGSGGSDHASFYNKRVPVAFLHTGLHPYYHTPDDDVERINFEGIEAIAKYAFELAWKIDNSTARPTFNIESFKEMPYTHDHGHNAFHTHEDHGHVHEADHDHPHEHPHLPETNIQKGTSNDNFQIRRFKRFVR